MTPILIALTGGIGAGKSVLSRVLRCLGYEVFDCDSEAKALMDRDDVIKARLAAEIAPEVISGGKINRKILAEIVFADADRLSALNAIVHSAVKEHLQRWRNGRDASVAFVETAILFESGLNRLVDAEWYVTAPPDIRIRRVMARNGLTATEVRRRIDSQAFTPSPDEPRPPRTVFVNDDRTPLLPQILACLRAL